MVNPQIKTKIGIIIPDRGDRSKFMANCLRMLAAQTLQPEIISAQSYSPKSKQCDITQRYRVGYDHLSSFGTLDLIAFIENDDWYAPNYLEYMVNAWEQHGRPDIFGTNYTIYYHLKLRRYFVFEHFDRASAMNTFIKPRIKIKWPLDYDPYTDLHLWRDIRGKVIKPERHISIGIKHGEGEVGGEFHTNMLERFDKEDNGLMKSTMDEESFKFYDNYFSK